MFKSYLPHNCSNMHLSTGYVTRCSGRKKANVPVQTNAEPKQKSESSKASMSSGEEERSSGSGSSSPRHQTSESNSSSTIGMQVSMSPGEEQTRKLSNSRTCRSSFFVIHGAP
jgi:hypothetical protein